MKFKWLYCPAVRRNNLDKHLGTRATTSLPLLDPVPPLAPDHPATTTLPAVASSPAQ